MLTDLVEAYYKENMGLVTHLQYAVQKEEDPEEEQGKWIIISFNYSVSFWFMSVFRIFKFKFFITNYIIIFVFLLGIIIIALA